MKNIIPIHNNQKIIVCLCNILLLSLLLSGCGSKKDQELETFQKQLDDFSAAVLELDSNINGINPTSDDAVTKLLSYYDTLETEFENLAAISVPEEYSDIARLSAKASEYMSEAVSYYHTAFESETLDPDILSLASSYYEKAFEFVNYIGQVLMGADITFQSDTEDSSGN